MGRRVRAFVVLAVLSAIALQAAAPAWGQPFNPTLIRNVPDWNQPNDYAAAPDNFTQPPAPPPDQPPGKPPTSPQGIFEWCTPTAATNVMGWFEDTQGRVFAGLSDGIKYRNAPPNNRVVPYPNQDTNLLNPGVADGKQDYDQNQWMDGVVEMGFHMNTQGWAGGALQAGTLTAAAPIGILSYTQSFLPATRWGSWNVQNLNAGASWNDFLTGGLKQNGAKLGDPVLVHWDKWINTAAAHAAGQPCSKGGIDFYDWSWPTSGALGHTTTGVGFWIGDPDGAAGPMPNTNWAIVHDNWPSTNPNGGLVAVPWSYVDSNNNLIYNWTANTHIQYQGAAFKAGVTPDLGGGFGLPSTRSPSLDAPATQWVADSWVCTTGLPIIGLRWWGVELEPPEQQGPWSFQIYEDAGGLPGSEAWNWLDLPDDLIVTSPTGAIDAEGRDILSYYLALPFAKWVFQAKGARYWFHVDRRTTGLPDAWGWLSGLGSSEHALTTDGSLWTLVPTVDLAFELRELVPEPATLLLFGAGAGLCAWRRRRRAHHTTCGECG